MKGSSPESVLPVGHECAPEVPAAGRLHIGQADFVAGEDFLLVFGLEAGGLQELYLFEGDGVFGNVEVVGVVDVAVDVGQGEGGGDQLL